MFVIHMVGRALAKSIKAKNVFEYKAKSADAKWILHMYFFCMAFGPIHKHLAFQTLYP